ncbi:MAG: ribosome rescue protein RqcH, partial [Candidatus Aenigmatarchaeota archaeon]
LRKYLRGKVIREINQHLFDRVLEIKTKDLTLVCELFGKGNFILVDGDGKIIQPMEVQKWSNREVVPKKEYKYPPSGADPRKIGKRELMRKVDDDREVVREIARGLNLGGQWAEEVCARAGIDKTTEGKDLTNQHVSKIKEAIDSIFSENRDAKLVRKEGKLVAAIPFPLQIFSDYEYESCSSFNRALDKYFSGEDVKKVEREKEEKKKEKVKKIERIEKEQKEAIEKWERIKKEAKEKADLIYNNYSLIEDVLNGMQKAIDSDLDWDEIKKRIKEEDSPEGRAIKEINEGDGVVVVEVEGEEIELDFRDSVEENAESLYEDAKWAENKMEKAKEKLEETRAEKKEVEEKDREEFVDKDKERAKPEEKVKVTKEEGWYKDYRWFKTSEDFLVVLGKSAKQNEELIKKKTEEEDVILHPELPKSPFIVVKTEDRDATPLAIREAAEFGACFSSAWKRGYGAVDVYWVRPDQVTKEAPSGEYIGKGSFMIKGDKNYLKKTELKIAIGVKLDREDNEIRVFNGSVQSVRNQSNYFVSLNPGETEMSELAKQVKNKLTEKASPEDKKFIKKIPLERFRPLIPPGGGVLVG